MKSSESPKGMGRVGVVIVAAGSGSRFGALRPKQYEDLLGIPVFMHAVRMFASIDRIQEIVIVVPAGDERKVEAMIEQSGGPNDVRVAAGGSTRGESVLEGIHALDVHDAEFVLVHDAVRALVTRELILRVIERTIETGAAIAAMPLVDTLKRAHSGTIETTVSREDLWRAQTPQGARLSVLRSAYQNARNQRYTATDESELLERAGVTVSIVEGDELNFKITVPADLARARMLLGV